MRVQSWSRKKNPRTKEIPREKKESINEARRRKAIADADRAEAAIARIKGETVLVSELQEWWSLVAREIRQSLEIIQRRHGKGPVHLLRTALVSAEQEFQRRFVGIELNQSYLDDFGLDRLRAAETGLTTREVRAGQQTIDFDGSPP